MRWKEQEQLVNAAPPPLPELRLRLLTFSLWGTGQIQSGDNLRTAILWMFCDHPVNRQNQAGNEMMCSSGIRVEHFRGSDAFGKRLDTNAAVVPYSLARSTTVIDEDWMHRLSNQDHRRPLYVQCHVSVLPWNLLIFLYCLCTKLKVTLF